MKPIVETLVGKTVEQALMEVAEEEELAEIREQQREYEELRNAELIELQRLEEQERRLRAEKDRRMKQAQESLQLEQDIAQKIAARAFAKAYLQDLVPSVFNNLRENGYFYDPVEHGMKSNAFQRRRFLFVFFFTIEIEISFMPWLIDQTMTQVNQLVLSRTILDSIIRDVVNQRIDNYDQLAQTLQQVTIFFLNNTRAISFFSFSKMFGGGVDMETSTADITHPTDSNHQRPESGSGEILVSHENVANDVGETNQNGN